MSTHGLAGWLPGATLRRKEDGTIVGVCPQCGAEGPIRGTHLDVDRVVLRFPIHYTLGDRLKNWWWNGGSELFWSLAILSILIALLSAAALA